MNIRREHESASDLLVGTILAVLSIFVIAQSLSMPRPRGWHSGPGLLPLVLGATLLAMSAALVAIAMREGGITRFHGAVQDMRRAGQPLVSQWLRALFIAGSVGVYVYILLRWLPFEVATFLYLSGVLGTLWRRGPLKVILVSAGVAVVLSLLFGKVLKTLLPGAGSLL